ncbi:Acetyl esterase/lipase [Spirosomataceae bacterium TFI 002]|nr:Acetyl esterase/lipase [Spirosomataceae bacterium TFI 002]
MKKLFILFASPLFILTSCSEVDMEENDVKPKQVLEQSLGEKLNESQVTSYKVHKDLKYGSDEFQSYDLYSPVKAENTPSPVMVVIHGGGWSLLDKSFMNLQIDEFKKENKNITIFNINHRLAGVNGAQYEQIIEDLDLVISEIKKKKSELNLTDDIILYGYSSGGHVALEYSKLRKSNSDIKAVAAAAPPTDLTSEKIRKSIIDDKNRNLTELLIGEPYEKNPEAYKNASPIYKVSANSKPTILFHGNSDDIINVEQVKKMSELLSQNGVENRFIQFQNVGHEFQNKQRDISKEVFNFLSQM